MSHNLAPISQHLKRLRVGEGFMEEVVLGYLSERPLGPGAGVPGCRTGGRKSRVTGSGGTEPGREGCNSRQFVATVGAGSVPGGGVCAGLGSKYEPGEASESLLPGLLGDPWQARWYLASLGHIRIVSFSPTFSGQEKQMSHYYTSSPLRMVCVVL